MIVSAALTASAQYSSFPATEGFEQIFTPGTNVVFIPNWTGNTVQSGSRIFADSANARTGAVALGVTPTSTFVAQIDVAFNLTGVSNFTADFWAKSDNNGGPGRPAIVYISTSIDGGVTFGPASQVGDSTTFPNNITSYNHYTYPFAFNTFNQPNVIMRISVSRGNGVGNTARLDMDDFTFAASATDVFPPQVISAVATSTSSVTVTYSEPVGASAESAGNYTGLTGIASAVRNGTNDVVTITLSTPLTEGQYYTLNVANVQDIAGNTMNPSQNFQLLFNDNTGNVKITELMYNNPGSDTLEFLEIKNLDAQSIDIGGWYFSQGITFAFPSNTVINAGQYLVIAKYPAFVDQFFNITGSYAWDAIAALNNTGENVALVNGQGTLIDSVHYLPNSGWDTTANGYGHSLVFCNESVDNDQSINWTRSLDFAGMLTNPTTVDSIWASPGSGCTLVGLAEIKTTAEKLSVYPNPAHGEVTVNVPQNVRTGTAGIYSMDGRLVVTSSFYSETKVVLNLKNVQPGSYYIQLTDDNNVRYTSPLIVR